MCLEVYSSVIGFTAPVLGEINSRGAKAAQRGVMALCLSWASCTTHSAGHPYNDGRSCKEHGRTLMLQDQIALRLATEPSRSQLGVKKRIDDDLEYLQLLPRASPLPRWNLQGPVGKSKFHLMSKRLVSQGFVARDLTQMYRACHSHPLYRDMYQGRRWFW